MNSPSNRTNLPPTPSRTKPMNTPFQEYAPSNHLPGPPLHVAQRATDGAREVANRITDAAKDTAQHATDVAKDVTQGVTEAARGAVQQATDGAREIVQTVSAKAEETLARTKDYVRLNPTPVLLGALSIGAALGLMALMKRRQQEPTFRERFVSEPLDTARKAIYAALAPLAHRMQ